MKMKEFGPPGGGASLAPPLDPPLKDATTAPVRHMSKDRIFKLALIHASMI